MRRWTLLLAGAALWLFLAAIPALADGGPHVASVNSGGGVTPLTADSCAGCHRAHTAQGEFLLIKANGPDLCVACHGAAGVGATTDVETGLQYTPAGTFGTDRGVALGALRSGGFIQARIASSLAYRTSYAGSHGVSFLAKVPVGSAANVTSAHLSLVGGKVSQTTGVAWGNLNPASGTASATAYAGPSVVMTCTSCHNPHGNNQYRILKGANVADLPNPAGSGTDTFYPAAAAAIVTDNPLAAAIPAGDARNYTVIQTNGGTGTLLASDVTALKLPDTAGDYFRKKVPWNSSAGANDAPNGLPANFTTQMAAWCLTCHTRYFSATGGTTDAIFKYRHTSDNTGRNCVTCHVAHGSNAQMKEYNSQHVAFPDNPLVNGVFNPVLPMNSPNLDSRLLKVDNRGTCTLCHDPTHTVKDTDPPFGTAPVPLLP